MTDPILEIERLHAGYGDLRVLHSVSLSAIPGRCTVVLGANGAGKTTLLSTIAGVLKAQAGSIRAAGRDLTRMPAHRRMDLGVALVQEGKRIFHQRTVLENLQIGGRSLSGPERVCAVERAFDRFPTLREKSAQRAGALSGGQQQMLAIAQALIPEPDVLMLDEPSAGLAPIIVKDVLSTVQRLKAEGKAVILVEQLVAEALSVADRVLVLDRGRIVIDRAVEDIDADEIKQVYLGMATDS